MWRTRGFRSTGLFWAVLSCALLVLAPTLARAQRALNAADPIWVALHEVCLAEGLVKVLPGEGAPDLAPDGGHEDCGYCQLASALHVPTAPRLPRVPPVAAHATRIHDAQADPRLLAWVRAAPRGPPLS